MYQGKSSSWRGGQNRYDNRPRRNPLPDGFSMFYIAAVCPPAIDDKVKSYKQYLETTYGCRAAAKSPAHITIVPPFRAEDELLKPLVDFVQAFNVGMLPIDIALNGYGNFADRVLFIDVEHQPALHQLEQEATQDFNQQFPSIIFGAKPDFNPHVTLATRDIPPGKLDEAKQYFETQHPFSEAFTAKSLTLFRLVGGWWQAQ
jgi:2'-5' RNA ligase